MRTTTRSTLFRTARVGKLIDGGLQLLGGVLLAAVPPAVVTGAANAVISRDLLGDDGGALADSLARPGADRAVAVAMLLAFGVVKIALAMARPSLLPLSCLVFSVFTVYEGLRAVRTGSVGLMVITAIDVAIVAVIAREYLRVSRR